MQQKNNKGYIDIHSHILPGVDDGASSMEETIEMLKIAYSEGVRTLVATPHNHPDMKYDNQRVQDTYEAVKEEAKKLYDDLELILGNEIYYHDDVVSELKSSNALTLGDTSYVLVEFDIMIEFSKMYKAIRRLIEARYRPIIAHVERYECLYKQYVRAQELVELGACIQMNSSSIIGGIFDARATYCRTLIEKKLVHFLGSDCHNLTTRPPQMERSIRVLRKKIDPAIVEKLTVLNGERLLGNRYVES
ncbi:CpsB/CapC family capsule biosynthesis tyrosine phosphatase [Anaeromicropila herbilytica]|uniref:protein-tyrosine-phosphatase n=1 Tax=Anaeromicropila herbilytica TaxID=2785025 RepID=A0A7R7IER0_9FIRM|nr:CpsB/CapC family capsule biosynthesis tyrosine phosphatase [Anaeromicropila herbilytica]BCN32286.1 tyrosine protein phosphatase [Anaeromicropila herbilytica]